MSERLSKEIISELNDAWLNIQLKNADVINPFELLRTDEPDEFHMKMTWLLMNPDYFCFICKHILNIELLPMQALILRELWDRKFPMLIASRGAGKAIRPDEKIRVKNGWTAIKDLKVGDQVYASNGKLCNVTYKTDLQKNLKMYRITLRDGRTIDCCEDHMWRVWDKYKNRSTDKLIWSELKTRDMINSYSITRTGKKSNGFEYRYALPVNQPISQDDSKSFVLHPYVVGVLLGDGCLTQKQVTISSLDKEVLDKFVSLLPYGYSLRSSNNKDYRIVKSDESVAPFYKLCVSAGIWGFDSHTKFVPEQYKYSGIDNLTELMFGLMDTDGYSSKEGILEYYTVSERLKNDFVDIVRSLGIQCREAIKESWIGDTQYSDCYRVSLYTDKPVFSLSRKLSYLSHTKSKAGRSKYEKVFITKIEPIEDSEGYCIQVDSPDHTYITKDYIVTHNTFLLSVYCLLRALLIPNRKIVVVGSAFRQSKYLYEYMENIWKNAPILRDICDENSGGRREVDMCKMVVNGSFISALPIGDGSRIRGQRAHDIINDEFASMSREIFENVIAGFAAVSASPSENVRRIAKEKKAKELGISLERIKDKAGELHKSNQIILSGTAYYDFNHFAEYWKRWKTIIHTKGDMRKIQNDVFKGEPIPDSFNYKDYSIIRIPVDLVPKGFMDEGQIARSKATIHNGIYQMEFGAIFAKDSQGFFKRSLIESCVGSDINPVKLPSGDVYFQPLLRGSTSRKYVMGVDPASERDNFSIIILELHPDHRRIVYCWTTTRKEHIRRVKLGLTQEDNFYSYCARKIRELMDLFPICHIAMDAQGGGISVSEALHDSKALKSSEVPIWPVIDEDDPKESDGKAGLHILELCQFAKYDWYSEANHGLRKDMEDKKIIFPMFDPVTIGLSIEEDKVKNRLYDTLEDCVMDIEELKNELCLIEVSQSANGRDRWDTPEIKIGVGKKEKMRKDRYSALIMANMSSRQIYHADVQQPYVSYGGFAGMVSSKDKKVEYIGPAWFTEAVKDIY